MLRIFTQTLFTTFGARLRIAIVAGMSTGLIALTAPSASIAEIYKWVDERGRVHFSDKRNAIPEAEQLNPIQLEDAKPNQILLQPEADTLIGTHFQQPQGNSTALTVGHWSQSGKKQKNVSLMRFDFSPLIQKLRANPSLKIFKAELLLFANTDDKLYGQGTSSQEPAGHANTSGDNAFYVKGAHNNWQENTATWQAYYASDNYIPNSVRKLPSVTVPGSGDVRDLDYTIDILPIIAYINEVNLNTVSFELSLQRTAAKAQVTFFSREAPADKRPHIVIEVYESSQKSPSK